MKEITSMTIDTEVVEEGVRDTIAIIMMKGQWEASRGTMQEIMKKRQWVASRGSIREIMKK
jgi:hypothetical protein